MLIRRLFGTHEQYYKLLHLRIGASDAEIKASYKKLVKDYHPDTTPLKDKNLAGEKFKNITEARNFLLENPYEPSKATIFDKKGKGFDFTENDFSYEKFKKGQDDWKKSEFRKYQEKQQEQRERERMHQENWDRQQREKYKKDKVKDSPEQEIQSFNGFFMAIFGMGLIICAFNIIKYTLNSAFQDNRPRLDLQSNSNVKSHSNSTLKPKPEPELRLNRNPEPDVIRKPKPDLIRKPEPELTRNPESIKLANLVRKPRNMLHYLGESGPHKKFLEVTKSTKNPRHSLYKCTTCKVIVSEPFIEQHVKENEVIYEFE